MPSGREAASEHSPFCSTETLIAVGIATSRPVALRCASIFAPTTAIVPAVTMRESAKRMLLICLHASASTRRYTARHPSRSSASKG